MNALDAELVLDRLEARLASELPAHVAASAHAYAQGTGGPLAIEIAHREVASVLAARTIDELRPRGTRLLRVIAPIVIESAPAVIAARALERTWDNWRALTAARDAESQLGFGMSYRVLVHALAGTSETTTAARSNVEVSDVVEGVSGWRTRDARDEDLHDDGPRPDEVIRSVWAHLRNDDSLGALSIVRSASAHPRTFVVERGVRTIIVVPERIDTPVARFAVLHELGHALLWLAPISRQHEWPRSIDEAAASYVARAMELDSARCDHDAIARWCSPLARAARERRLGIARMLDALEEGGASPDSAGPVDIEHPPWALWNDPHAQAAYVEAERIADDMPAGLRGSMLAEYLATRSSAIDARGW